MEQENNNPKKNNSGFNPYWIYGIIFLAIIGVNIFYISNPSQDPINYSRFQKMAESGDIDKVEVINGNKVYVYLKKEAVAKEEYKDALKSNFSGRPNYHFNSGPSEHFAEKVDKMNETLPNKIDINYSEKENWLGTILGFLIPFLIILALWMYVMRKVGGGGAGPGGQLFNIGKSKATLFEKNLNTQINFEDVAGLEEAKEEVMEVVDFLKNP